MQQSTYLGTDFPPGSVPTSDERTMAVLAHILNLVFPLFAPLIIYLVKKDESKFVAYHAKESLNFQITLLIIVIILFISIIGILLVWIVGVVSLILSIVATVKASDGQLYKYPFNFRLVR